MVLGKAFICLLLKALVEMDMFGSLLYFYRLILQSNHNKHYMVFFIFLSYKYIRPNVFLDRLGGVGVLMESQEYFRGTRFKKVENH